MTSGQWTGFGMVWGIVLGDAHYEEDADEDADEGETFGAETEVVDFDKDDGEGLEPDVQETVYQGDVEIEEEDHGLRKVEAYRSDDSDECNLGHGQYVVMGGPDFRVAM